MIFRHLLNMRSHPTWVRGLKPTGQINGWAQKGVAPYVGAWIETLLLCFIVKHITSRTLRGCVD